VLAAALLGVGLLLLVVPPLVRDGICGIFGCADQVPDIAVTRTSADRVAILVPTAAAPDVRVVRLLQGGGSSGSQQWLVRRTPAGSTAAARAATPDAFVAGETPEGFRTATELAADPATAAPGDRWVAEVAFRCTTASLPFTPSTLGVGTLRSWTGATDGARFSDDARTEERCGTERSGVERVLAWLGAAMALGGAILGIVVVLGRPPRDDDEWADSEEPGSGGPAGRP
jgi:hypothetical protein